MAEEKKVIMQESKKDIIPFGQTTNKLPIVNLSPKVQQQTNSSNQNKSNDNKKDK
jgi:hypothetical protein